MVGGPGSNPTILAGTWPKLLGSSVSAEPEGAWAALKALRDAPNDTPPRHVRLVTDHEPMVFAALNRRAKAYTYNELLLRLQTLPFHVSLEFLPGRLNPADAPSRGIEVSPDDIAAFRQHTLSTPTKDEPRIRFMT